MCGRRHANLRGGGNAALEHIGLVAELAQPGRHHRRPHMLGVGQQQPRAPHPHPLVRRLDQLAARRVREARHGVGGKLLGRAHVEKVGRARGVREPGVGLAGSDEFHLVGHGEPARAGLELSGIGAGGGLVRIAPARAMLELEAGEEPALGAVLQRVDRIGQAEIDQRLRADDGARAAGAVDDDLGLRVGDDVADAQRQLAVRAADAAGDVHPWRIRRAGGRRR